MRKQILWLVVFVLAFLITSVICVWLTQPPFWLNRKVIAKLHQNPEYLLVTDLDTDGQSEILVIDEYRTLFWIHSLFDNPSVIKIAGCKALEDYKSAEEIPMRSVPVFVGDKLRLLRWRNDKATFESLSFVPNKVDRLGICQGKGTGTVFLAVYSGANAWVFALTEEGEWEFAGKFVSEGFRENPVHSSGYIHDLADLDKDGKLDAICVQWHPGEWAWVVWGNEKKGETDLGTWTRFGYPLVSDLNGDGWDEIAMVASSPAEHIQIWRFDPKRKKLKVIAKSQALNLALGWQLFDLDGDGLDEIVVADYCNGEWLVFKVRHERLWMWRGRKVGLGHGLIIGSVRYLVTFAERKVWLFPPLIWFEGKKPQWKWREEVLHSILWELPKGKDALSPSKWHKLEAPFELDIVADVDGDSNNELIGRDGRGCYRFYWFQKAKSGELQWRSTFLGKHRIWDWTLIREGNRRGLCIAWSNGLIELLTVHRR